METEMPISLAGWQEEIVQEFMQEDRPAVNEAREYLKVNGIGTWLYVGAGGDKRPLALAPVGTHHWWIDLGYDPRHRWYDEKRIPKIFSFFKKLGINPSIVPDLDNKYRSDLRLEDKTMVSFVGGIGEDSNNYPSEADVVFVADKSFSDPQTLVRLKTGGLYVSMFSGNSDPLISLFPKLPEEYGLTVVREYSLSNLPQMGGKFGEGCIRIYQKTRNLTLAETQVLSITGLLEMFHQNPRETVLARYKNFTFPKGSDSEFYEALIGIVNSRLDAFPKPTKEVIATIKEVLNDTFDKEPPSEYTEYNMFFQKVIVLRQKLDQLLETIET